MFTESDYEYDERNIRGHLLHRYSVKVMQESDYEYDERNIHGHLLRRYSVKVMQVMLAPVKLRVNNHFLLRYQVLGCC
jgi:hypothetical protein